MFEEEYYDDESAAAEEAAYQEFLQQEADAEAEAMEAESQQAVEQCCMEEDYYPVERPKPRVEMNDITMEKFKRESEEVHHCGSGLATDRRLRRH